MFSKIINPKTNRKVNITSKTGQSVLKKYENILQSQTGGQWSGTPIGRSLEPSLPKCTFSITDREAIRSKSVNYHTGQMFNMVQQTVIPKLCPGEDINIKIVEAGASGMANIINNRCINTSTKNDEQGLFVKVIVPENCSDEKWVDGSLQLNEIDSLLILMKKNLLRFGKISSQKKANSTALIQGLITKPELNDTGAKIISGPEPVTGRYIVLCQYDNKERAIKPENLKLTILKGSQVEVKNLINKPELNGKKATVLAELDHSNGRVQVKFMHDGVTRSIKPVNLIIYPTPIKDDDTVGTIDSTAFPNILPIYGYVIDPTTSAYVVGNKNIRKGRQMLIGSGGSDPSIPHNGVNTPLISNYIWNNMSSDDRQKIKALDQSGKGIYTFLFTERLTHIWDKRKKTFIYNGAELPDEYNSTYTMFQKEVEDVRFSIPGSSPKKHIEFLTGFDILLNLCIDFAKGLHSLHDNDIIHNDIKPDNLAIKITPGATAEDLPNIVGKIIDLGALSENDHGPNGYIITPGYQDYVIDETRFGKGFYNNIAIRAAAGASSHEALQRPIVTKLPIPASRELDYMKDVYALAVSLLEISYPFIEGGPHIESGFTVNQGLPDKYKIPSIRLLNILTKCLDPDRTTRMPLTGKVSLIAELENLKTIMNGPYRFISDKEVKAIHEAARQAEIKAQYHQVGPGGAKGTSSKPGSRALLEKSKYTAPKFSKRYALGKSPNNPEYLQRSKSQIRNPYLSKKVVKLKARSPSKDKVPKSETYTFPSPFATVREIEPSPPKRNIYDMSIPISTLTDKELEELYNNSLSKKKIIGVRADTHIRYGIDQVQRWERESQAGDELSRRQAERNKS